MAIIKLEIEFDFDEFELLNEKEKVEAVNTVLQSGAETTNTYININKIKIEED